ncbi:hypothetical protein [Petropleomorpha daqingensis]|uniref:Fumarate reductase subunit C n=1 Tax=Petropleomorpha daqingensis TaxID=2026353 RepID=A0A853CHZ2_9ACTN|nr:hypothetical protein [Petropleomorpha daqingensis]NYJ05888.1 fumarate reductase subunit C [Petropleomorpha daqingensis]
MRRDLPLPPWPRLRETWWVYALGAALVALYCAGLFVRIRCTFLGHCGGPARLFDLDALGGVPRLVTTALFVGTAALAWFAARRCVGRRALWWRAVAGVGVVLALAKFFSWHSLAKADSAVLTLLVSVVLAALGLGALAVLGRRWAVSATRPVVTALALYALAAIGLDAVTWLIAAVQAQPGALSAAAATFVEEFGEALAALVLLVTVRWQAAARRRTGPRSPEMAL